MEEKKIRVGVIGIHRGRSMIEYARRAGNVQLVAVCDRNVEKLNELAAECEGEGITFYPNWDDFIKHDMDAVVLATPETKKVPFAIDAMNHGIHVISELLPFQTMKEAVELLEAVERTGCIYCYAENYCYMEGTWEMKKLYEAGEIGTFEYGEGEYVHDREHFICGPEPSKDMLQRYATWYCTHAIGPILWISGLRPKKVTGFELPHNNRMARLGLRCGGGGIEMIELENGALIKAYHGEASATSIWYTAYGSKGRMETERYIPETDYCTKLHVESYAEEGHYDDAKYECYYPTDEMSKDMQGFDFSGADYRMMWNAIEKIKGNPNARPIGIYEAYDMFLPGHFAYRSILAGGIPMEIPDLRKQEERDKWRNDTACTDPKLAGDMLWPTYSRGEIHIDPAVYENQTKRFHEGKPGLRDGKLARWELTAHLSDDRPKI